MFVHLFGKGKTAYHSNSHLRLVGLTREVEQELEKEEEA